MQRKYEKIFKLNRCLDLVVRIEKQRLKTMPGQCFCCQRYGHSQAPCQMRVRCVRCSEEHRATDYERNRKQSASCALCNKAYPANYRGCEYAPKPKEATPVTQGETFAAVVGQKSQALRRQHTTTKSSQPEPVKRQKASKANTSPATTNPMPLRDKIPHSRDWVPHQPDRVLHPQQDPPHLEDQHRFHSQRTS